MNKNIKGIVVSSLALALIAGIVTAALAGTNALTEDTIAARDEATATAARLQVLEADSFEKQLMTVDGAEVEYYVGIQDGATVGYVFTAESTGKSAGLKVMTGIRRDGTISGVAVTSDNETAGYVDKVEKGGLLTALQGKNAKALEFGVDVDGVSQATKPRRASSMPSTRPLLILTRSPPCRRTIRPGRRKGRAGHEPVCQ